MTNPDVCIFQSRRFNLKPDPTWADPNDHPLGIDLANYIIAGLDAEGVVVEPPTALEEDSYWLVRFVFEKTKFDMLIHWAPMGESNEDWWVIRYFPRKKTHARETETKAQMLRIQKILAGILAEDETLAHPRWMKEEEFLKLY